MPRDATSSELNPARKLPVLFESRDMLVRVGYAIGPLQALLVDEPVVSHRNISVFREHRDAAREAQATQES